MNDRRPETTAAARMFGLTKRFEGFQLGPLDLTLEPGTVLALVGPNGAGKTTTLNCMVGLIVPDEGGTEIYGTPVKPNQPGYRREVGYVGEESGFFQRWTAGRNLDFLAKQMPGWSKNRAHQLADLQRLNVALAVFHPTTHGGLYCQVLQLDQHLTRLNSGYGLFVIT